MRLSRRLLLVVLLAVSASACSSGDDEGEAAPSTSESPASDIAYEVFSSDEGAGCGVFVSVPTEAVDDSSDIRAMIWAGIVAEEFTTCGFSDVVEAGLITVNGLDSYNQPDWSTVEEHGFFGVAGWDTLLADCYEAPITDACVETLEASLTE